GLEEAGEPVPGALPAWDSLGPTYTSGTVPTQHTVSVPAHSAGDLLLLSVAMRNNNQDSALASVDTDGWTIIGGQTYGGAQNTHLAAAWKIGDGQETDVKFTCTGGTTTDGVSSRVHVFTAANGFATTAVQGAAAQTG